VLIYIKMINTKTEEEAILLLCSKTHQAVEDMLPPEFFFQPACDSSGFFRLSFYQWIKQKIGLGTFSAGITAVVVFSSMTFVNISADQKAALIPSAPKAAPRKQPPKQIEKKAVKKFSGSGSASRTSSTRTVQSALKKPETKRADNRKGVYLTAASVAREKFLKDTVAELAESNGDSLVFDVKGGVVLFHSAAPLAKESDLIRPAYDLPEILKIAEENGIYTIGRFVAIKDYGLTAKKPETRIKDPKTGRVLSRDWIDPADDTAIEYNMQVICELAKAGIDEINLDYIRFSTAEWRALSVYSGEEKADRVEKFLKSARDTVDRCGPATKLGISTYAILGWNYENNLQTLGQDVVRFAPLVDVISPMAYPSTFAPNAYYRPGEDPGPRNYFLVYRTLTGYRELLGPEQSKKIRPWIQGYGVKSKDVSDEIRAVYDAGFCGFTVWNANNGYAPAYLAFKNDRLRPERCK